MKKFINKSKHLLLKVLQEPGGMSFFPSSFFWTESEVIDLDLESIYRSFFQEVGSDHLINLYVHIPFCSRICTYCNCFKNLLKVESETSKYISLLEIHSKKVFQQNGYKKIVVNSIFIGGGTPNILSSQNFDRLFSIVNTYYDISQISEYILDGHPNFYTPEKIKLFYDNGITRVTLAVQSFDEITLSQNNRDSYDITHIRSILKLLKEYKIKSNIDLLVGLKGQTIASVIDDIEITRCLSADNVSVHYFMNSNNICYETPIGYGILVSDVKDYLKNKPLPNKSPNIQENDYASRKSSTIGIGAHAVTHLFGKIIYKNSGISEYKKSISGDFFPKLKGKLLSNKDEMIKYIYLNILSGIDIIAFKKIFGVNIFLEFPFEFRFLHDKKVVYKKDNIIFSNINNLDTFIYFNIFFINELHKLSPSGDISLLEGFFSKQGELIDK